MSITQEQINQASESLKKLPPSSELAYKYIASDDFNHNLYSYKALAHYELRQGLENLSKEFIGEDMVDLCHQIYWKDTCSDTAGADYRSYILRATAKAQEHLDRIVDEYKLNDYFGKKFDVIGTQGARAVKNCDVDNAYVLKFEGYFQLSVLKGDGEKAGDYEYVTTMDTLKEIALGLPYLMSLNEQRCRRELKEMRERGNLSNGKVAFNKWFITDELFESILSEAMNVQEQTYAVIRRSFGDYDSFQVKPDKELTGLLDVWKVVGKGMTFTIANEMYRRASRVVTIRHSIDRSASRIETLQTKLQKAQDEAEKLSLEFASQCRNLDSFVSNNSVDECVIVELNKGLTKIKK